MKSYRVVVLRETHKKERVYAARVHRERSMPDFDLTTPHGQLGLDLWCQASAFGDLYAVDQREDFPDRMTAQHWAEARIAELLAEEELRAQDEEDAADLCQGILSEGIAREAERRVTA